MNEKQPEQKQSPKETDIAWIGCPMTMVSNNDTYEPSQGWFPSVHIGLRKDGTVVWRKADPNKRFDR